MGLVLRIPYNVENKLTQATSNLNGTESYGYDPAGYRVWKQGPDTVIHVFYNGGDGKPLADFHWDTGLGAARGGDPNLYFAGKRVDNAAVEDRLGTAVVSGDQTRMSFFPYGELRSGTTTEVQYATYKRDSVTNLDYAQQRYYSGQISRFTAPDPYDGSADGQAPQTFNRYAYAGTDPVNANDPTGLDNCKVNDGGVPCFDIQVDYIDLETSENYDVPMGPVTVSAGLGSDPGIEEASLRPPPMFLLLLPRRQFDISRILARMKDAAIALALSKLTTNKTDCYGLFNARETMDPREALNWLSAGNTLYGSIFYGEIENPEIGAETIGFPTSETEPAFQGVGAWIVLNNSIRSSWFQLGAVNRAAIIIHELAHAYNKIFGPGSSAIVDESTAKTPAEKEAISIANQQMILESCFK
jgi:RHS repeat-associated protein